MYTVFLRHLAQVAVAQICEGPIGENKVAFDAVQKSARDALAEVMMRYISEVGQGAHDAAELAGRTEPNVTDVLVALDELGTSMRDIMLYQESSEEVPFAKPLPRFPMQRTPRLGPSFREATEEPPAHIPAFLPALPDQHTYRATATYAGRPVDAKAATLQSYDNRNMADEAMLGLLERTHPTAPANYLTVTNSKLWEHQGTASAAAAAAPRAEPRVGNLFLAPPLRPSASSNANPAGTSAGSAGWAIQGGVMTEAAEAAAGEGAAAPPGQENGAMEILDGGASGGAEEGTREAQPPAWLTRSDRAPLKFAVDYAARSRRVSRIVRDIAPTTSRKRAFQQMAGGAGDDPEKESRVRRAKAIISGAIGTVIEDEGTTAGTN